MAQAARTTLFWIYVGVTAALGIAAAILAVPGIGTILVIFTFGLALPLLAIPTLFCYALSLGPAAFLLRSGATAAALAAAALGPLALAWGLPGLATAIAERQAGAAAAHDVALRRASPPRRVEFIDQARFWNGRSDPLEALACNPICQKLLIGGEADAVRMTSVRGLGGAKPVATGAVTYRFERRATCPAAFARAESAEPATARALVEGRCIVPDLAANDAMDVRVTLISRHPGPTRKGERAVASPRAAPFVAPGAEKRLEIADLAGAQPALLRRQTETNWRQPPTPFYIGWRLAMQSGDGPDMRSAARRSRPIDLEQALRETLGYRLELDLKAAPAPDAALAARILSEPGAARFGAEKQALVSNALRAIASKPALDDADIALARRAVADLRIDDAHGLTEVFSRHPRAAEAALPEILAHLAIPSTDQKGHMHSQLAWSVTRLPPAAVRPYREKIAAILAADPLWGPAPLMIALGRLGGDPSALFAERLKVERGSVAHTAAKAICAADESLAPQLLPLARDILDRAASADRQRPDRDKVEIMLLALRRFGQDDEARRRIAALAPEPRDAERLTRRVFDRRSATGARLCDASLRG